MNLVNALRHLYAFAAPVRLPTLPCTPDFALYARLYESYLDAFPTLCAPLDSNGTATHSQHLAHTA
jgi:hypothetical protein